MGINLPTGTYVQFLFLWHTLYSSIYHFISLLTLNYQKFQVTNSIVFYCPPYPPTGVSWYSLITSILNNSSLGIYTFSSLSISPLCSLYSSSLNIFAPTFFISSTTLITLLSFASLFLILFNISTPSITTSITSAAFTSNYSFFINICSLLSFLTLTCQSSLLLNPSALPIFSLNTCFKRKSNLDK